MMGVFTNKKQIKELNRALKKGGTITISDSANAFKVQKQDKLKLKDLFLKNGFEVVKEAEISNFNKAKGEITQHEASYLIAQLPIKILTFKKTKDVT